MKDLTQGSIPRHLITLSVPIFFGMLAQTLYFLTDLYFVGNLGDAAIAGLSMSANFMFVILALTQVLNVGTATLIAHAVGRKQQGRANALFNQSLSIAVFATLSTVIIGYLVAEPYLNFISHHAPTITAGLTYLHYFIPCMALQFIVTAIAAALRGTGIVKPAIQVQILSFLVNIVLTPILVAGWGTGVALGIAGAGIASLTASLFSVLLLCWKFQRLDKYICVQFHQLRPDFNQWIKLLKVGLPAGGEFFNQFLFLGIGFWAVQSFGSDAQAAYGLGMRIMQSLFLPAMAVALALPAIAGQNFGAENHQRVKQSFAWTIGLSTLLMTLISLIVLSFPESLFIAFTDSQQVLNFSTDYITIVCINFIPVGIVMCCSGVLQATGNTLPSFIANSIKLIAFALPVIYLSLNGNQDIHLIWYSSVISVFVHLLIIGWFIHCELNARLGGVSFGFKPA